MNTTPLICEKVMRSFYSTNHAPYYVCSLDYIQQSAGIRALHYLCHALNEKGFEAYMTCKVTHSALRTPILNEAVLSQHHAAGRKPIVVYPEIIPGDPLAAGGIVARWLLNRPGLITGDVCYAAEELIFTYDPIYLIEGMHAEVLHIPTIDTSIFNNEDNPYDNARDLVCFYAHKYLLSGGMLTEHAKGAISLGKENKLTHAEMVAMLRRSKVLYVYESTAMITEALLCGCPVSVIETDYWHSSMASYVYNGDLGVVMNDQPESIELATKNAYKFGKFYNEVVIRDAWHHVNRFIEITQEAARTKGLFKNHS